MYVPATAANSVYSDQGLTARVLGNQGHCVAVYRLLPSCPGIYPQLPKSSRRLQRTTSFIPATVPEDHCRGPLLDEYLFPVEWLCMRLQAYSTRQCGTGR